MVKPIWGDYVVPVERRVHPSIFPFIDKLEKERERKEAEEREKREMQACQDNSEAKRVILLKLIPQFAKENGLESSKNRGGIDCIRVKFLWDYLSFRRWLFVVVGDRSPSSIGADQILRVDVYGGLVRNDDMWLPYCVLTNEDQFRKWFPCSIFEISLSGILWRYGLERGFKKELSKIYNLTNKLDEQSPLTEDEIGRRCISC